MLAEADFNLRYLLSSCPKRGSRLVLKLIQVYRKILVLRQLQLVIAYNWKVNFCRNNPLKVWNKPFSLQPFEFRSYNWSDSIELLVESNK